MAKPDLSMFPEPELEIVNRAREELRDYGGKQVSDWSHEQSAGWNLAKEDGQGIPYETAYISMDEPTEEMHAYLQERAQRENWASLRP
jgi:hypothetical protein